MNRAQLFSAALLFVVVGGSGVSYAENEHDKDQKHHQQPAPVPQKEQDKRMQQEQKRVTQYRQHLDQQVPAVEKQAAQLESQRRMAQAHAQQEYAAQLEQQRQRLQTHHDYSHDPYISTPHTYRYNSGHGNRETNEYGADVLKHAVNFGYEQGYRAGDADRQDHWRSKYQDSFAYRDANYGYDGSYVDQDDYNYYFRQGFRRGYEDGYYARSQYGSASNGSFMILDAVLGSILILKVVY